MQIQHLKLRTQAIICAICYVDCVIEN